MWRYLSRVTSLRKRDVLIVAREPHRRALFAAFFTLAGFRCVTAASMDEARRSAAAVRFHAVVVDDTSCPERAEAIGIEQWMSQLGSPPRLVALTAEHPSSRQDPAAFVDVVQRLIAC